MDCVSQPVSLPQRAPLPVPILCKTSARSGACGRRSNGASERARGRERERESERRGAPCWLSFRHPIYVRRPRFFSAPTRWCMGYRVANKCEMREKREMREISLSSDFPECVRIGLFRHCKSIQCDILLTFLVQNRRWNRQRSRSQRRRGTRSWSWRRCRVEVTEDAAPPSLLRISFCGSSGKVTQLTPCLSLSLLLLPPPPSLLRVYLLNCNWNQFDFNLAMSDDFFLHFSGRF